MAAFKNKAKAQGYSFKLST